MEEPIQHRAGDDLVAAKDRAPFFEWFVRRQDDGAVLVETADELEEEISPPRIHGQIAKLIEDQELETADGIEPGAQRVIHGGGDEFVEDLRDRPKHHALVHRARADADGDRQMTFPDPRWPAQDQPFGALKEAELREFPHECRGNGGLELKLKLLQGLEHREAGARDARIHRAIRFRGEFLVDEMAEKARIALLGLRRLLRFVLEDCGDRMQAQPLEIRLQPRDVRAHLSTGRILYQNRRLKTVPLCRSKSVPPR